MRCCVPAWTPRKQRHTITRIYCRLIGEHQMLDVSRDRGGFAQPLALAMILNGER